MDVFFEHLCCILEQDDCTPYTTQCIFVVDLLLAGGVICWFRDVVHVTGMHVHQGYLQGPSQTMIKRV